MRILFVTDSSLDQARGGAEVSAFQLALGLGEEGHEVVFATRSRNKSPYEARHFQGSLAAPMLKIPGTGGYLETGIASSLPLSSLIVQMLANGRFDIIHAHNWLSAYAAYRARTSLPKGARQPWVLSIRDYRFLCPSTYGWCFSDPCPQCGLVASARCVIRHSPASGLAKALGILPYSAFRNVSWRILMRSLRAFDAFVCCSHFLKLRLRALVTIDGPILAVHNAVETGPTSEDPQHEVEEILYVGRLSIEKGLMVLLTAFRNLVERKLVRLTIVGTGPLETGIRRLCLNEPTLRDSVQIVGQVKPSSVEQYYRRASIVVTPSIWPEPFGRVPAESMAAGRPVVASGTGGIPEVVDQGRTGILVPPRDVGALQEALEKLISNPEKRARMGRRGIRRAQQSFSRDTIASRFVKLYEGLTLSTE